MKKNLCEVAIMLSRYFLIGFIIQFIALNTLLGKSGEAQLNTRIHANLQNVSVKQVLDAIKKESGFTFVYDSRDINAGRKINIRGNDLNVQDILDLLASKFNFSFKVIGKTITVKAPGARPDAYALPEIPPAGSMQSMVNYRVPGIKILQFRVSGIVTDSAGNPLIGVTVQVKGSKAGTTTNTRGHFEIDASKNAVLVFSYVGYQIKEMPVNGRETVNVTLSASSTGLNEVVVVGYGTQKKTDLTGAISSISEKELQSRPVPSFQGALQGRASGVQVAQTGGDLDGRFSINIRGAGTVTSSNQPLIVVDGVPLADGVGLSTINPRDILSIDILKDASATAIYGARASNGVIMVSTRRGTSGKTSITFSTNIGFEKISKMYKMLTSEQQRRLFEQAFINTNRDPSAYQDPDDSVWQVDNNWQKLGTRVALRQNYYLGISGGGPNNRFAISAGYLKRQGIMKNSDLAKYYFRANNDIDVGKRLKISSAFTVGYQKQHVLPNDDFNSGNLGGYESLVDEHSFNPAFDKEGNLKATNTSASPFFGANGNPLIAQLLPTRRENTIRLLGSIKADYKITDGLTLSGNFGTDIVSGHHYTYLPIYTIGMFSNKEGSTTNSNSQRLNWVADATLTYSKDFGSHRIKLLAGASAQEFRRVNDATTGTGTTNNSLNQLSNQTTFNATGSDVKSGLLSSFFRVNYGYNNKYLLTATIRRDGSSKFGPEKRYGVFPSASAAWRISREKFFHSSFINNLKFRAGYGLTGNQDIPDFAYITRAGASPYVFGNSVTVGNSVLNVGNPELQWESAKQLDVGLDISILNGRLKATIDYYNKRSDNLLVQVPLPYTAGVRENPTVNLGSVENEGMELLISSINFNGKFKWTTDFNISYNKNKVLNIGANSIGQPLQVPGTTLGIARDFANLTVAGRPIGAFYMYKFMGIWQTDEASQAAEYNAVPGDPRYADLNNNGELDAGDKAFVGSPQPKYYGGLNNVFSYGNFSLTAFINFSGGNKLYNGMRNLNARAVPYNQQLAEVADFWTPQNPSNKVPRPSQGGNTTSLVTMVSTRFLENAGYLRMKNISISYDIPDSQLQQVGLQAASITLAGTDIFTFTKYSGLDPESASKGGLTSGGLDFTPYPPTRYYYLLLSITF